MIWKETARFGNAGVGIVVAVLLAACGGGDSVVTEPQRPDGLPTSDEARRMSMLAGNGQIIEKAVTDRIDFGTDWEYVKYSWNGSELRFDIYESDINVPSNIAVSMSSQNDAVHSFTFPALSGTNIQSRKRAEFQVGQSVGTKDTIGRIGVDYSLNDNNDYFVYGYWLTVDHADRRPAADSLAATVVGAGAFSSAFVARAMLPAGGGATYIGKEQASGLHTIRYSGKTPNRPKASPFCQGCDDFRIAHFVGDVELKADFDNDTISGKIHKIYYPNPEESFRGPAPGSGGKRAFEIKLDQAGIGPSGYFLGTAETHSNGDKEWSTYRPDLPQIVQSEGEGYWEGQFSSRNVGQLNAAVPRAAGGTFVTKYEFEEGSVGTYIGTFSAGLCSNPAC